MEVEKFEREIEKIKDEAGRNTLNHFNRLHDRLFDSNNILIAGYFALSQTQNEINIRYLFIPLSNLVILVLIEYLLMQKSRKEYGVQDFGLDEFINFVDTKDTRTNLYSLVASISTLSVFVYFMYLILITTSK